MKDIYYMVADRPQKQINSFKNRYNFVSETEIKDVFLKHWYEVENLEKSSSWWTAHLVYYATIKWKNWRLIFRSNSWEKGWFKTPEIVMLTEKYVTDIVNTSWVNTNKIIKVDISRKNFPFDYQIEEEIIWIDPEKYIDSDWKFLWTQKEYEKMTFELWQSIAKYSNIKFERFWLFDEKEILNWKLIWFSETFFEYITTNLEEHLDYLVKFNVIKNQDKTKIIKIFDYNKELINNCEPCLVHHDLADHNITFNQKTWWLWAIFDWEAMVLWDPMLDLWSCPTWESHYPKKEFLIKWFKSIKKLPDNYELRMNLYELRTWIWKTMFFYRMNFDEKIKQMWINWIYNLLKTF